MTRPLATSPHRVTVQNHVVAALAAGMLAAGAAVAFSATAAADEPPPPPPAAAPIPRRHLRVSCRRRERFRASCPRERWIRGRVTTSCWAKRRCPRRRAASPPRLSWGRTASPSRRPSRRQSSIRRQFKPLSPTNFALAGQGQQSIYSNTPAAPDAPPPGFLANAKGAHGIWNYQIGKLDPNQLGEPLPGTAPPPGTNIPAGLGESLPDPLAPPPGAPPIIPPPAG